MDEVNSISDVTTPVSYQYLDERPGKGENIYRVKEVFADGNSTYSELRLVEFELDLSTIIVFPNPTALDIFVSLKEFEGQSAVIEVFNVLGQPITKLDLDIVPASPVLVELNNTRAGLYTVTIQIDNNRRITKLFTIIEP